MDSVYNTYVFLSAELACLDRAQNNERTQRLYDMIKSDYRVAIEVAGFYKGASERSFMVWVRNDTDIDVLLGIAASFMQESILVVHGDKTCQLHYTDGRLFEIGLWTNISEERLHRYNSYTKVAGLYYAAT
jgi:hypothetical protein